jgi:phage shock protein C
MPMYKQLRRSRTEKMVAGVCGGVARYFAVDPVAVRVAFVLLAFLSGGLAVLAYVVAWAVMPEEPVYPPTAPYPPQSDQSPPTPPAA